MNRAINMDQHTSIEHITVNMVNRCSTVLNAQEQTSLVLVNLQCLFDFFFGGINYQLRDTNLSDFYKYIFICVPKTNVLWVWNNMRLSK